LSSVEPAPDSWSTAAPIELEPTAAPAAGFETGYQAAPEAAFEPTSAAHFEPEPAPALEAGFEPTSPPSTIDVPAGAMDPALITDNAEMATAFPTKFGVENADIVPVGNASDFPELYGEPQAAEKSEEYPTAVEIPAPAAETSWVAEEAHLEDHEHGVMLHEEMQQQFAKTISAIQAEPTQKIEAAPEPESESLTQAEPAPPAVFAHPENAPDHELAAAMAAAVGSAVEPAVSEAMAQSASPELGPGESTIPLDQHTAIIAEVVHRVTERIKPELIEQITREIAAELARKKK
ncbi:MAG TPA: hypothetical protein VGR50_08605, partial [Terriglobales bacterium]|nr:hypothetical protein [Terriglobales bacterium]